MQLFTQVPRQYAPAVIPNDVPVYKVGAGKFYVDDELLNEGTLITWEEEPNPDLIPMNKLAVEKMREYLQQLDVWGHEKAVADKKKYVPLLGKFEAAIAEKEGDGRRARVLNGRGEERSILGKKRGRPRITKLTDEEMPETISFTDERDAVNENMGMNSKAGKLNG